MPGGCFSFQEHLYFTPGAKRRVECDEGVFYDRYPDLRFLTGSVEGSMAEPSYDELRARVAELEKQKSGRRGGQLEFKVGEKGGVSVYGLGRFPVTLYYEQWVRLLDAAGDLRTFLEENKAEGKLKLRDK